MPLNITKANSEYIRKTFGHYSRDTLCKTIYNKEKKREGGLKRFNAFKLISADKETLLNYLDNMINRRCVTEKERNLL